MLHNKAKALNRLGYWYWLIILQPTSAASEQIKCWGIRMDVEKSMFRPTLDNISLP